MSSSVALGDSLQVSGSLSYIFEPQHPSVIELLNLSTTELIIPATPTVPPSTARTSSSNSNPDIKNSSAGYRPNESEREIFHQKRFMFSNGFCCCDLAIQSGCLGEDLGAGWELNHNKVTSLSAHCLNSRHSPLNSKSESLINVTKSNTKLHSNSSLNKTFSTGRIDTVAVRYNRGYPYQKDFIPFNFQHFENEVASMNIDLYRKLFTYSNIDDHLKSTVSSSSLLATSVVAPKLLVLGINKPGASDLPRPRYNRLLNKVSSTQSAPHMTSTVCGDAYCTPRQRHGIETGPPRPYQLCPWLPVDLVPQSNCSANSLEVHHGQSDPRQLSHLPSPDMSDSLPLLPKSFAGSDRRHDNRQVRQFRDILCFDDTWDLHKKTKSTVTWASRKFPLDPVISTKHCDTASSSVSGSLVASQPPRQQKLISKSFNRFDSPKHVTHSSLNAASFPRLGNKHTFTEKTHSPVLNKLGTDDSSGTPVSNPAPLDIVVTGKAGAGKSTSQISYQHKQLKSSFQLHQ